MPVTTQGIAVIDGFGSSTVEYYIALPWRYRQLHGRLLTAERWISMGDEVPSRPSYTPPSDPVPRVTMQSRHLGLIPAERWGPLQ